MKKVLALLVFLVGGVAHAGFTAEPYLGYDNLSIKGQLVGSSTEAKATGTGIAFGARLGYEFSPTFWIAADYKGGSGKDDSAAATEYTQASTALLFGTQIKQVRLWAGYGFSDKFTMKSTTSLDFTGTNIRFGGGYETSKNVFANVEVVMPKYTKISTAAGEVELDQVYQSFDIVSVMLSVSYKFGGK